MIGQSEKSRIEIESEYQLMGHPVLEIKEGVEWSHRPGLLNRGVVRCLGRALRNKLNQLLRSKSTSMRRMAHILV